MTNTNTPQPPRIEKGIQVPFVSGFNSKATVLPILKMAIGDSIFIPESIYPRWNLQQNLSRFSGLTGWTISIRRRIENGISGHRIWRREDNLENRNVPNLRIDKGLPVSTIGKWGYALELLDKTICRMQVGESFVESQIPYQIVRNHLRFNYPKLGFVSRRFSDGYRYWRIS
jgi:hypothetical protein